MALIAVLVLATVCMFADGKSTVLVLSERTPKNISQVFGQKSELYDSLNVKLVEGKDIQMYAVLVDLSYSVEISYDLAKIAEESNKVHILLASENFEYRLGQRSFQPSKTGLKHGEALKLLLDQLTWERLCAFNGGSVFHTEAFSAIKSEFEFAETAIVKNELTQSSTDSLVGKYIKPLGVRFYTLLLEPNAAYNTLISLWRKNLADVGFGIILSQKGLWYRSQIDPETAEEVTVLNTGILGITEYGMEQAAQEHEYFLKIIERVISLLSDVNEEVSDEAFAQLKAGFPDKFSVCNIVDGAVKIVGTIENGAVSLNGTQLMFPGPSSDPPVNEKPTINVGFASGGMNLNGFVWPDAENTHNGARFGFAKISTLSSVLPYYNIKVHEFSMGTHIFEYNWAVEQILAQCTEDELGVAVLSPFSAGPAAGLYQILEDFEWEKLEMAATASGADLTSEADKPKFIRVNTDNQMYAYSTIALMFNHRWSQIGVLYMGIAFQTEIYNFLVDFIDNSNGRYRIVNSEENRRIPPGLSKEQFFKDYRQVFQEIVDSQVKIVQLLITAPTAYWALELLYDLGVRAGDQVHIASYYLFRSALIADDQEEFDKRMEVLIGGIQAYPSKCQGEEGDKFCTEYQATYNENPVTPSCYHNDAALALGFGFDYALAQGLDLNKPLELKYAIRNLRYSGCSGLVVFDQENNNRGNIQFDINNLQLINGEYSIVTVGQFFPQLGTIFNLENDIVFGDGTTEVPPDTNKVNYDCPVDDPAADESDFGEIANLIVCLGIVLVIVISCFLFYRFVARKIKIGPLTKNVNSNYQDFCIVMMMVIEFLQLLALTLSVKKFTQTVPLLASEFLKMVQMSILDLHEIVDLNDGTFYTLVLTIIGIMSFFFVFVSISITPLRRLAKKTFFLAWFVYYKAYIMLVIGYLGFVPYLFVLSNVFLCIEEVDGTIYMEMDCHKECWDQEHTSIAAVSAIYILAFIPIVILLKLRLQKALNGAYLQQSPTHLIIKTILQGALLFVRNAVGVYSTATHGGLSVVLMICYLAAQRRVKPYNVPRINVYNICLTVGVIWIAICLLLAEVTSTDTMIWAILCFAGLFVIITVASIIAIRTKTFLKTRHDRDIAEYFRFQLTFDKNVTLAKSLHGNLSLFINEISFLDRSK